MWAAQSASHNKQPILFTLVLQHHVIFNHTIRRETRKSIIAAFPAALLQLVQYTIQYTTWTTADEMPVILYRCSTDRQCETHHFLLHATSHLRLADVHKPE